MNAMTEGSRGKVKYAIFIAVPTLMAGIMIVGAFLWYRHYHDPIRRGQDLNRTAWEETYRERGEEVPASGPREGYWGKRIGKKRWHPDAAIRWREPLTFVAGLIDVDENGFQRWIRPATNVSGDPLA